MRWARWLLLLLLTAWFCASPIDVPSAHAQPATPQPSPSAEPPDNHFFARYIKTPTDLGFFPNATLFDAAYKKITTLHVDKDDDEALFKGVAGSLRKLLAEAKVDPAALNSLKLAPTLPNEVMRLYNGKVDSRLLWYAMIRGLFEGTNDPYSYLLTPDEYREMEQSLDDRSYAGLGVYIELDPDRGNALSIIDTIPGSPAQKAGLLGGDRILQIDGKPTAGLSIEVLSRMLSGKAGTAVDLLVARDGVDPPRPFRIERGEIDIPTLSYQMLPARIGWIRLHVYGATTSSEFTDALTHLNQEGARALILDVRNNGGGYLTAAIELCSHFIAQTDLVTYLTDRAGERRDCKPEPVKRVTLPVVLLVNGHSASASEVTAGCLKDNKGATLIGSRTFGKGCVQQLYPLHDGAAFKLTIAYFFTPHGNRIHKVGIEPDVKVDMDARLVGRIDRDVQLRAAMQFLKKKLQ